MDITIMIPHYKTPKMTLYSVYEFIRNKGRHNISIIVIDNNAGDGTIESLRVFGKQIEIYFYPKDILQSHGISFDWVMPHVKTDYFITVESDSFPTNDKWLDYYEGLINQGYDAAGSLLQLSGGYYLHPCGAIYSKKLWQEAKEYCDNIEYTYFPNMCKKEGFDCHLMVHNRALNPFLNAPDLFVPLADGYKNKTQSEILGRSKYYKPVVGPFHNGMGNLQESVKTYGQRNLEKDVPEILLNNEETFIRRIGYEPGQFLTYWMLATGKKVFSIPTETFWMPNRVNQQQERTINICGFTHVWGGSSWKFCDKPDVQDIVKRKQDVENELWDSLPEEIKNPT